MITSSATPTIIISHKLVSIEVSPTSELCCSKFDSNISLKMDVMVDRETKTVKKTVVQVYGAGTSSCGYCTGNVESSLSYGVVSNLMMTEDYESLMLIGWRRSGTVNHYVLSNCSITALFCCILHPFRFQICSIT
jgi:Arginine-tRNA-protein transferase, N terminus